MTMNIDGARQSWLLKKTWSDDISGDVKSVDMPREDSPVLNK